jgi:hypothetical protein
MASSLSPGGHYFKQQQSQTGWSFLEAKSWSQGALLEEWNREILPPASSLSLSGEKVARLNSNAAQQTRWQKFALSALYDIQFHVGGVEIHAAIPYN